VPAGYSNSGGRYDPVANAWQPVSTINAFRQSPPYRRLARTQMIVWGIYWQSTAQNRRPLRPATDTWKPTSLARPLRPRDFIAASGPALR